MKKTGKILMSLLCLTTLFVSGLSVQTGAAEAADAPEAIRIYGTITDSTSDRITLLRQDHNMNGQDLVITISEETRVLDAVTGFPADKESLKKGDSIYAYIGPAMTLSLPPMANASMVLTNIPADYKVPEYVTSKSLTINSDGVSGKLTGTNQTTYTIPSDCVIIPFLTRNIVTINNLNPGSTSLIWTESSSDTATKIVIFPEKQTDNGIQTGWVQDQTSWYYYNQDGIMHKGWLLDGGSWYYLDADNGVMKTGFVTVDGKTYYMKADGKMQTKSFTLTPDENGALH